MEDTRGGPAFARHGGRRRVVAGEVVMHVEDQVGLFWLEVWDGVGNVNESYGKEEEKEV